MGKTPVFLPGAVVKLYGLYNNRPVAVRLYDFKPGLDDAKEILAVDSGGLGYRINAESPEFKRGQVRLVKPNLFDSLRNYFSYRDIPSQPKKKCMPTKHKNGAVVEFEEHDVPLIPVPRLSSTLIRPSEETLSALENPRNFTLTIPEAKE